MIKEKLALVSIVLPTYNGSKYIKKSIDSCVNQTYKNLELIIVDDGSTDKTDEIIESYKDERIKYIKHKKNKGLPFALNTGFAESTGDYLTWTSDDNYYTDNAIKKMLTYLKSKNCDFIYCNYYYFNEDKTANLNIAKLPNTINLKNGNHIGPCFLYTRKVKDIIGEYDLDTELAEDYDYWLRISKKFSMQHLGETLYFFRVHKESLYVSKFYEVKVVDFLVRIKNNILNERQVTDLFIDLIAQKKNTRFKLISSIGIFNRTLLRFNKLLIKISVSKKIEIILKNFKLRKISLQKAKLKLENIM